MATDTSAEKTHVEQALWAVTPAGPRALRADPRAQSVHELLEHLPDGVYSALRTFHHDRFLRLDAHIDRTERSMSGLGWTARLDRDALRRALHAAIAAWPQAEARVRFDVLREPVELQGVEASMFLALSPHTPVPAEFLRDGVHVDLAPGLVRSTPRIKTTAFVRARKPLPYGTRERFESLLLDPERRILECTSANVSFVRGKTIVSAGDGVLEGITSLVLRELAAQLGLAWESERLALDDLARVDEAFLSSSVRGIVPIVRAVDVAIGDGRVGPRTRGLLASYAACCEREARPALESPRT